MRDRNFFLRLVVFFILSLKFMSISSACGIFDTKKVCECTAMYTMGVYDLVEKPLYQFPSRTDCSSLSDCSDKKKTECKEYCVRQINTYFGDNDASFTTTGMNTICKILANDGNNVAADRRIRLVGHWRYVGCDGAIGFETIVDQLCCNPKCKCNIVGQRVSSPIVDMIMDLTEAARPIDESYHCSAIEIDTCQDRCLAALAKELNVVRPAEPDRINWDAFKENQEAAKEICSRYMANMANNNIQQSIFRPGLDVYIDLEDNESSETVVASSKRRSFTLGRVCCRQMRLSDCSCTFQIYDDNNAYINFSDEFFSQLIPQQFASGYECSREIPDCMAYCRAQSIAGFDEMEAANKPENTITENNFYDIGYQDFFPRLCKLIQQVGYRSTNPSYYFDVYSSFLNRNYQTPDDINELHLMGFCCSQFFDNDGVPEPFSVSYFCKNNLVP